MFRQHCTMLNKGSELTVHFADLTMDNTVALVHVYILHTILLPLTQHFVDLLTAFHFGRIQSNHSKSWLYLEHTGEPVLTGERETLVLWRIVGVS